MSCGRLHAFTDLIDKRNRRNASARLFDVTFSSFACKKDQQPLGLA